MAKDNSTNDRILVPYFEGINTGVVGHALKIQELSRSENARSTKIGLIEKRGGYNRLGDALSSTANYGLFYSEDLDKIYRVSTVAATTAVYYLNASLAWTTLTGSGTGLTATEVDFTEAEQNLFIVNGTDANRYITSDGTTVTTASTATGHLYNSPPAYKINFYKGRIYLGDYTLSGGTRQKNGVMFSSPLVGIVSLVDEDHLGSASSPITALTVTDTKYIYSSDTLEVYRGGTKITATLGDSTTQFDITNPSGTTFRYTYDGTGTDPAISTYVSVGTELTLAAENFTAANNGTFTITAVAATYFEVTNASGVAENNKTIGTGSITINTITVTAKTENQLTITSFTSNINSSDELWVKGTKLGNKVFRWAGDGAAGTSIKEYDTFKLDGSGLNQITMMDNVGDVMVIGSKKNMAVWNGYNLRNFNAGLGCPSPHGYIVKEGVLYFVSYKGIAATDGETIPKIISNKVKRYFDGASRTGTGGVGGIENAIASENDESVFFYLGNVTLYYEDGSVEDTLTDVVIEYNIVQNNFFPHTGLEMDYATSYLTQTSRVEYIAFSKPTDDYVYLFPYGYDDNGNEIFFDITTAPITLAKNFENISYPLEVIVESKQGTEIRAFINLDEGHQPYEVEGQARQGCTVFKVTSQTQTDYAARCRILNVSLRESSTRSCKISRMAIIHSPTEEVENYHE